MILAFARIRNQPDVNHVFLVEGREAIEKDGLLQVIVCIDFSPQPIVVHQYIERRDLLPLADFEKFVHLRFR